MGPILEGRRPAALLVATGRTLRHDDHVHISVWH
jgi:hypothetical protein